MVTSTQGDDVMEVQIFHMPLLPNMMISGMLLHIRWSFKQASNEWLPQLQVRWRTCLMPLVLRLRGSMMQVSFSEAAMIVPGRGLTMLHAKCCMSNFSMVLHECCKCI